MSMTTNMVLPPGAADAAADPLDPVVNAPRVAELVRELLIALGEDPAREGLVDTPDRVAAWWSAFLSPDPAATATCFTETQAADQLVVVGGMSVWSVCEHHMLPMNLTVHVGYVANGTVLGLSKFGRIARRYGGRFQMQERFTRQLRDEVSAALGHPDVAVAVQGAHLCMSMRGVRMETARTSTLQSSGRFATDALLSQQFLALAAGPREGV
jgi:GTP cyclohydrolase I